MVPFSYKVKIKYDTDKELDFNAETVIYDEGGDNSIRIVAMMDVDQMEVLDQIEQNGIKVEFSFEPFNCMVGDSITECDEKVKDYFSDDGEARLTWVLENNVAIIHLYRITNEK